MGPLTIRPQRTKLTTAQTQIIYKEEWARAMNILTIEEPPVPLKVRWLPASVGGQYDVDEYVPFLGRIKKKKRTISLNKGLLIHEQAVRDTLRHEISHFAAMRTKPQETHGPLFQFYLKELEGTPAVNLSDYGLVRNDIEKKGILSWL